MPRKGPVGEPPQENIDLTQVEEVRPTGEAGMVLTFNEIDQLTADFASKPDPIDDVELPDRSSPVISALGDLFALGDHRLFVGDAREPENFRCLMGDERADVAILDAPYNRPSDQIGGRGRTKHDDFLMGSGEMSNAEFVKFLRQTHANVANFSRDGQSIILSWTGVVFAG